MGICPKPIGKGCSVCHYVVSLPLHLFPIAFEQSNKTFQQVFMETSVYFVERFCAFGLKKLGKGVCSVSATI